MLATKSINGRRYEIVRRRLEGRAHEVADSLQALHQLVPSELAEVPDEADYGTREFLSALDFALIEMQSRTLAEITDALGRLHSGTYGVCSDCGLRIARTRLHALPFAERCLQCQETSEAGHAPATHSLRHAHLSDR